MRRITVIGMIILGLVALPLMAAATPAPDKKVEICHSTGDGDFHTVEVSRNALQAHLDHGDPEGACDESVATFSATIGTACTFLGCPVTLDATGLNGEGPFIWSGPNPVDGISATEVMILPPAQTSVVSLSFVGADGTILISRPITLP